MPPLPYTSYTWDATAGRYRDRPSGRFVSWTTVREGLLRGQEDAARDVRALTQRLRDGEITLREWQRGMAAEIRATHLTHAAIAAGGFDRMTQADYGRVGGQVRAELVYLRARALRIADGRQALDGTILRIAESYVQAGRNTYFRARRAEALKLGYDEELNVLHARESCHNDPTTERVGCAEQTALGWVPIGTLVPIGARTCLRSCLCTVTFKRSRDGATMEG